LRIKDKLEQLKHLPQKSLGQNFLINEQHIDKIIDKALQASPKKIIEVGPGLGALTDKLVFFLEKKPIPFEIIELDINLYHHWKEKIQESKLETVKIHNQDALRFDWSNVISENTVLVSNLPYQISSSLVIDRSMDLLPLQTMVLMFQKEVAERLQAQVSDGSYGFLSVLAQSFWKIEKVLDAGPKDFYPAPKIASRVLHFEQDVKIKSKHKFLKFMKACFFQPRKLMISNLESQYNISKVKSLEFLKQLGINEKIRAEQLTVIQFHELFKLTNEGEL
jgi:16S rRNA (adenine1518-N6/adenine1519-N6)-dimethyltransferase